MNYNIEQLKGKKICAVYCRQQDDNPNSDKMQISTLHGIAKIKNNGLYIDVGSGNPIPIPQTSYKNIFPNDGTQMLKDAQYFVMIKVHGKLN